MCNRLIHQYPHPILGVVNLAATDHSLPDSHVGTNHQPITNGIVVGCANGSRMMQATATDTLAIPELPIKAWYCHKFKDILHLPLISVPKLCQAGCQVEFQTDKVNISDVNGQHLLTGTHDPPARNRSMPPHTNTNGNTDDHHGPPPHCCKCLHDATDVEPPIIPPCNRRIPPTKCLQNCHHQWVPRHMARPHGPPGGHTTPGITAVYHTRSLADDPTMYLVHATTTSKHSGQNKNGMAPAAEANAGALFMNAQEAISIRQYIIEPGHPQPATPLKTDNSTAQGILTGTIKQKRSKAVDMRFYWLKDRTEQGQFDIYRQPGKTT